jgi:hypothetical protein
MRTDSVDAGDKHHPRLGRAGGGGLLGRRPVAVGQHAVEEVAERRIRRLGEQRLIGSDLREIVVQASPGRGETSWSYCVPMTRAIQR